MRENKLLQPLNFFDQESGENCSLGAEETSGMETGGGK